jgi:chromosome segregation ATPase
MKKIKYYYNTQTLRYEKLVTPLRVKLLRVFSFLAVALVTSAIISVFAFRFIGSPAEKLLQAENERLKYRYQDLGEEVNEIKQQMKELENRDNTVYRTIFEAKPIPDSARAMELEKQQEIAKVESIREDQLVRSIETSLKTLTNRITVQKKSYEELAVLIKNKEQILAATPAIQPVSMQPFQKPVYSDRAKNKATSLVA